MFTTKCSGMSATTQICYFPATNLSSSFLKFTLLLSGSQHFSWTLLCSPDPLCDLVNSAIKLHILDPLIPKWSTGSSFLYPKKRNTLWQYRNLARWFLLRWKKEKTKNGEWIGCGRCASGMVVRSRAGLFDLIFENYSGFSQWQASLIWSCIHRYKSIQKAIAFFFFFIIQLKELVMNHSPLCHSPTVESAALMNVFCLNIHTHRNMLTKHHQISTTHNWYERGWHL